MSSSSPLTRSIFLSVSFFLSVRRSVLSYSFYIDLWRCFVGCFPSVCPIIIINWLSNSLPYYYYHYSYFFLTKEKYSIWFDFIHFEFHWTFLPRPPSDPPTHSHKWRNYFNYWNIQAARRLPRAHFQEKNETNKQKNIEIKIKPTENSKKNKK